MITSGVPSTLVTGRDGGRRQNRQQFLFQQALEFIHILDLLAIGFVAQLLQHLMGGSGAEVGANQRGFQIVQRGAVDLLADGDDIFDALGQVLARARDGLLHALNETWFLFFVQTAKKGLNHEVSDLIIGEAGAEKVVVCDQ